MKFLSDDDISAVKEELVRKMEAHATADSSDRSSSDSSTVTSSMATSSDSNTQKALDIILGQDEGRDST